MATDEANVEQILRLVEEAPCDLRRLGSVLDPVQSSTGCIGSLIRLFDRHNLVVDQLLVVIFWGLLTGVAFLRHTERVLVPSLSAGIIRKRLRNDLLDDRQSFLSIIQFCLELRGLDSQLGRLVALGQELIRFCSC